MTWLFAWVCCYLATHNAQLCLLIHVFSHTLHATLTQHSTRHVAWCKRALHVTRHVTRHVKQESTRNEDHKCPTTDHSYSNVAASIYFIAENPMSFLSHRMNVFSLRIQEQSFHNRRFYIVRMPSTSGSLQFEVVLFALSFCNTARSSMPYWRPDSSFPL